MEAHAPPRPRPYARRGGARLGLTLALGVLFVGGGVLGLAQVRPNLKDQLWERFIQKEVARRPDTVDTAPGELEEGWIRVRVGGRQAVATESAEGPGTSGAGSSGAGSSGAGSSGAGSSDFVLVVQPGQTLRRIALEHYRRADGALLDALARYNELGNPDDLLAGSQLHLPELSRLGYP